MARCPDCRKLVTSTRWEKIRMFFFRRFHQDIQDLREDMYTKGTSDGYKSGFQQATELNRKFHEKI